MNDSEIPQVPTQRDIARKLGLTTATISLALRNHPRIRIETRQRIQAAAAEMGYQPNPMGAGLAAFKRTSAKKPTQPVLAWASGWKELKRYNEFMGYWNGATACAKKFGFRIEEFQLDQRLTLDRLHKELQTRSIQGILLPPFGSSRVAWDSFNWEPFSVMRFGRSSWPPKCHFVTSAHIYNAMLALDRMRELGYKRIAYAGACHRDCTFGAGCLWAEADWPEQNQVEPFYTKTQDYNFSTRTFAAWLKREKPDAILTECADIPDMLKKAGYRVPDDIGLAATTVLDTPIDAGIDQNPEEIGRVAALVLISMIHDNDRGLPKICREILIQGRWIDGSSLPRRT